MRLAANRPWNVQFRLRVSEGIAQRTNANLMASSFVQGLGAFDGGRIQLAPGVASNPWKRIVENSFLGATDYTIQLSATIISRGVIETADVATVFFNAVKTAGNPGFSTTRLVEALPAAGGGCGSVDTAAGIRSLFGSDVIIRVCLDASPADPASATNRPPETTMSDSVTASAGSVIVRDSTDPREVGLSVRPLSQRIPDGAGGLWDAIPLSYKIGGGAVIGIVALVALGYAYRSVK
jgi:hypothetical protein